MKVKQKLNKLCKECGADLVRKHKEPKVSFNRRIYCNRQCMYKNRTEDISGHVKCCNCKKILPKTDFYKRKNRPRGVSYKCKKCCIDTINRRKFKPQTTGNKICNKCNEDKLLTDFFVYSRNKDGRSGHCKTCANKKKLDRLNKNPHVRITENLRRRMRGVLKGENKSDSSLALIGCSSIELQSYIENLWTMGMNWGNYGEWHIDHIKPCSSFDLSDPKQQMECFNYTNLQPLWAEDNLKKGASL